MANISTMGRATYTLTVQDVTNGFFAVPILWDTPFNDTNYICSWSILDEYFPVPTLDFGQGDIHYKRGDGFIAVVTIPGAAPIVQGQWDDFDEDASIVLSFQPLQSTMYAVSIYLNPKVGENSANFAGDAMQVNISWQGEPPDGVLTFSPTDTIITAQGNSASNTSPFYAAAGGAPITLTTEFTTYSIAGSVPTSTWFVTGSFSGTPWVSGTTITQVGGATAEYYGTFNNGGLAIIYKILTGSDNGGNWSHGGVTFTTTGTPTQPSPFIYGPSGGILQQAVTGASGAELDALSGTGIQHVGPGITGGTPDATHVWIDVVTGGVLIPSAVPTLDTFHYHISARIVQMPNNASAPQAGAQVTIEAMASHR